MEMSFAGTRVCIEEFNKEDQKRMESLIYCYQDVFANQPWNEWKKCCSCHTKYGKSEEEKILKNYLCPDCGSKLVDFWEYEEVKNDIIEQLEMPHSRCYLLVYGNNVVGFTWAFKLDVNEFEEHLNLRGIKEALLENFENPETFIYQDEIGIARKFQGKKLATVLFKKLFSTYKNNKNTICVARTKTKPPPVLYPWYNRLGFKEIIEYKNDPDGRVILAINIGKLNGYLQ